MRANMWMKSATGLNPSQDRRRRPTGSKVRAKTVRSAPPLFVGWFSRFGGGVIYKRKTLSSGSQCSLVGGNVSPLGVGKNSPLQQQTQDELILEIAVSIL